MLGVVSEEEAWHMTILPLMHQSSITATDCVETAYLLFIHNYHSAVKHCLIAFRVTVGPIQTARDVAPRRCPNRAIIMKQAGWISPQTILILKTFAVNIKPLRIAIFGHF
jgi:hypothetical protein